MSEPLEFPVDRDLETELRRILLEANTPEALGVPAELEPVPAELEVRMARFLQDPFRAAKRTRRPRWRRVLTNVACVLLALSLTLGGILFVSPTARAWAERVINYFMTWGDRNTTFHFGGTQPVGIADDPWRPTYLPEGFVEVNELNLSGAHVIEYTNSDGRSIDFEYMPVQGGLMLDMDNEHSDYSEFVMNGQTAYLFDGNSEDDLWSYLVWFNETGTISYNLMGDVTGEELMKIAESVVKLTWEPAYLPEGYERMETFASDRRHVFVYEHKDGTIINFEYAPVWDYEVYSMDIDSRYPGYSRVMVNGQAACLLESSDPDEPSRLVWFNEDESLEYYLMGCLPKDELIKIAGSIEIRF